MNSRDPTPEDGQAVSRRETWNHTTPILFSPLFDWPPRPGAAFLALTKRWVTISRNVLFLLTAILVYHYLVPDLAAMKALSIDWVAPVLLRNVMLMLLVAGALHLYLFTFRAQGKRLKYDARQELEKSRKFSFNDQVRDNMCWSLVGAAIWSGYEVLYFWALANGMVPAFTFVQQPVGFIVWLLVLPIVLSSHFFLIHRLLHWPPLYRRIHSMHHRNIHIGPWSGMSMHPIEQVIYLSSVLIHFVIPSSPIIVLLHLYTRSLGPAFSHAGFEKLLVQETRLIDAADFHHQLHHRYFECNYGTVDAPWDRWFGSFHDGSEEATMRTRERQRRMHRKKSKAA